MCLHILRDPLSVKLIYIPLCLASYHTSLLSPNMCCDNALYLRLYFDSLKFFPLHNMTAITIAVLLCSSRYSRVKLYFKFFSWIVSWIWQVKRQLEKKIIRLYLQVHGKVWMNTADIHEYLSARKHWCGSDFTAKYSHYMIEYNENVSFIPYL